MMQIIMLLFLPTFVIGMSMYIFLVVADAIADLVGIPS